jgi:transcriptional regulator with PAS, ATPase and Fis domain
MIAPTPTAPDVVVGRSARMRAVFEFLRVIGTSESTVLITGESGTGKEVTATLIHQGSRRAHRPFVAVSCALFSESLIESELFGHERGAFTGAVRDRPGRFEMADGGTLFLDDIDDVPLSMQVKLLRVLQNRTIERLGGTRTVPVNVRIIAGSKKNLQQMVADGRFREDLFYRLNVLPLTLPPLRERREDIPALMDHFIERYFRRKGDDVPPISETVRQAFLRYRWPGNVRELENACERIAQMCGCGMVGIGCVAASVLLQGDGPLPELHAAATPPPAEPPVFESAPTQAPPSLCQDAPISLDDRMRELEASLIGWALKVSHGNKSRAAELLQIKRSTLGDRINRCGLARVASSAHGEHRVPTLAST